MHFLSEFQLIGNFLSGHSSFLYNSVCVDVSVNVSVSLSVLAWQQLSENVSMTVSVSMRERERVCMCVCVTERDRQADRKADGELYLKLLLIVFNSDISYSNLTDTWLFSYNIVMNWLGTLYSLGSSLHLLVLPCISVNQIVTTCSLVGGNRHFEGTCWLHVMDRHRVRMQPGYTGGLYGSVSMWPCLPNLVTYLSYSLLHWKWMQHALPKCFFPHTMPHIVRTCKTTIWIHTTIATWKFIPLINTLQQSVQVTVSFSWHIRRYGHLQAQHQNLTHHTEIKSSNLANNKNILHSNTIHI
jgi:hypothetical protein